MANASGCRDDVHLEQVFDDFRPDITLHLAAETDLEYCEMNSKIVRTLIPAPPGQWRIFVAAIIPRWFT